MANLINANSNQNYFQFHKSHYKYEQGEPLGLPVYWKKTGLLRTKISNHNIIYSS